METSLESILAGLADGIVESLNRMRQRDDDCTNGDIARLIGAAVKSFVGTIDMSEQMDVIAMVEGASEIRLELPTTNATLGQAVASVLEGVLTERLEPLKVALQQQNYDGRTVQVLLTAGQIAATLVETNASRFVRRADVDRFCGLVDVMAADQTAPSDADLCEMMELGVGFFTMLHPCLDIPEMGEASGITEKSVGMKASDVFDIFSKMSDIQHLNRLPRTSAAFREALVRELDNLPSAMNRSAGSF